MRLILTILLAITITSCELFVIGEKVPTKEVIDINQTSSISTVYLFKEELDRNNYRGAAQVLATVKGRLEPINQYDKYYELIRLSNALDGREATSYQIDTLDSETHQVKVVYDYFIKYIYNTKKLDSNWYILNYGKVED